MAQNWFKHDYGARNDEKILELRSEYGWEGYGIFFGLVEFMCETETGCIDTDRIGGLSVGYGVAKDRLLAIIDFCISIDLFYVDDDGLVRNDRVVKHLESMKTFKEAGKKGAKKRWNKRSNRGANRGAIEGVNADKIRLDKIRLDNTTQKVVDLITDIESIECKHTLLALHIWKDVNDLRPNNKTTLNAKVESWSEPIRLMVEQDERTHEEIWALWKKVRADDFWKANILSTAKLRQKFDQLAIKFQSNGKNYEQFIDSLYA